MNPVSEPGKPQSSETYRRTIPTRYLCATKCGAYPQISPLVNLVVEIHFPINPSSAIPVPLPVDPRSGRSTRLYPSHETDLPKPSSVPTSPTVLPLDPNPASGPSHPGNIFPSTFPDSLTCGRFRREPVQLVGEKDHVELGWHWGCIVL